MSEFWDATKSFLVKVLNLLKEFWNYEYSLQILGVLVALIVLFIIYRSIKRRFAPIKLFNNTAGIVSVTPAALNELVQSVCYSLGALNRPSVKIYTRRGRLCMIVSIKLEIGQKLIETSATLQEELTNACRNQLGVEKLGRIDVRIKGFKGIAKKPSKTHDIIDGVRKDSDNTTTPENTPFSPLE